MKLANCQKGTVQNKFPKKHFFTYFVQLLPIRIYIPGIRCSIVVGNNNTRVMVMAYAYRMTL